MDSYTSTSRKDGSGWTVTCDQLPSVVAQASAFDEAEASIREAIGREIGVDPTDFIVTVIVSD